MALSTWMRFTHCNLSPSTERPVVRSRQVSWLRGFEALPQRSSSAFPSSRGDSGIRKIRSPITVAGPRRFRTDFPFVPSMGTSSDTGTTWYRIGLCLSRKRCATHGNVAQDRKVVLFSKNLPSGSLQLTGATGRLRQDETGMSHIFGA